MKKKLIYSLTVLRADFKIYEVKQNKKRCYLTEFKDDVHFDCSGGEMKIVTYVNDTFRGAVNRLRVEVGKRVEEHVHLMALDLPI